MQISLIRVWISEKALARMVSDAGSFFPNETGGVLMGYRVANEVVITDSVGGGPLAQRSPTRFLPDHSYQTRAIEEIYDSSAGGRSYLGDWHTHPRGRLALSPTDVMTLRRIARHRDARVASPKMRYLGIFLRISVSESESKGRRACFDMLSISERRVKKFRV